MHVMATAVIALVKVHTHGRRMAQMQLGENMPAVRIAGLCGRLPKQ
jgi:hypothetical protein